MPQEYACHFALDASIAWHAIMLKFICGIVKTCAYVCMLHAAYTETTEATRVDNTHLFT